MTYVGALQGSGGSGTGTQSSLSFMPGSGISGLASGMNTDSIVSGLVGAAQVPLVQELQQRQIDQWQAERYQEVNASLSQLQDSVSNLQLQSTFMQHTVSSSNSSLVTATADTMTPNGSYNVSVSQLASGAGVWSGSALNAPNGGDTTLATLGFSSQTNVTVNGQALQFQPTDTINSVLQTLSSNTNTGVTGFYDTSTSRVVLQTTATGSGAKIDVSNDPSGLFKALNLSSASSITSTVSLASGASQSGTVEINGQQVKINTGDSLQTIIGNINKVTNQTGVYASVDSTGQHIVLQSAGANSSSGATDVLYSAISVSDPNGLLGLQSAPTANQSVAQDASYTVNGYTSTSASNSVNYNGLQLNLLGATSGPVTVSVSTDTKSIVQAVTDFVKQYNQTLQFMQGLYNEQRNYSYQPLTSTQASQMTQTQIDKWNTMAQSGLLSNDTLLGGVMNDMESIIATPVSGQPSSVINGQNQTLNSLASIGIQPFNPQSGPDPGYATPAVTTTGWNTYGLLEINTDKLTQALQADPQAVMRLFTNNPSVSGAAYPNMTAGLATQLYSRLTSDIAQLTQQAGPASNIQPPTGVTPPLLDASPIDPNANFNTLFGTDSADISFLGQEISSIDSMATSMQNQVSELRQRYQNEFSQMEQSLSSLSSQSGYMTSMVSGGTSTGG